MSNIYKAKAHQYLMVHCLQGKRKAEGTRWWRQERLRLAGVALPASLLCWKSLSMYDILPWSSTDGARMLVSHGFLAEVPYHRGRFMR